MPCVSARANSDPLAPFHPAVREWFSAVVRGTDPAANARLAGDRARRLDADSRADRQRQDADGVSLVPRSLMFAPPPDKRRRCRVLYVSPLKALAVDVERNLRAPLAGIARVAERRGDAYRDADDRHPHRRHAAAERARFQREPADILITTPESLYLLLTSNAREALRGVETIIIDEIHALVPTKRGAHLAISIERLHGALRSRRRSASACRRRSGRSTRWRAFWAARTDAKPPLGLQASGSVGPRHRSGAVPRPSRARHRTSATNSPSTTATRPLPAGHHRRRRRQEGARAPDRGAGRGHGAR